MNLKKRIFSTVLILSLVLTTLFAGTGSALAESSKAVQDGPTVGSPMMDAGLMRAASGGTDIQNAISAVGLNSSDQLKWNPTVNYSYNNPIYVAVNIPKAGNFVFGLLPMDTTYVALYDSLDSTATPIKTGTYYAATDGNDISYFSVQVKKAGVYYLVFQGSNYSSTYSGLAVAYAPSHKAGGTNTLTSGKDRYISVSGSSYRYFKITTAGTRYLTISFPWGDGSNSKYKVKLMNYNKKKNLLKGVVTVGSGRNYVTYAGVPKGTYYVAVSTATDTCYSLNVKANKVTENSGSTRAKAKRIYKGGTKNGIITATQSSTSGDWYKFVIGSSQKVKFNVTTKTGGYSGGLKISVYSGNKTKAFGTAEYYYGDPASALTLYTSYNGGKLSKGTYYIKVQKYGSGSGYYKLQWT